jgi:hypothetical protein
MSVAAALKNVILVMLIILILHFLIKNINLERRTDNRFASLLGESGGENKEKCIPYIAIEARTCPPSSDDDDDDEEEGEEDTMKSAPTLAVCGEKVVDFRDELQRFVFEDHGELEKFFVPVDNDKNFDNEFKIQCDANVEEKRKMEEVLERTKDDSNKKNAGRIDELSFINEYHPDKAPLDNDLMAYDTFGSLFGSACGSASTPWDAPPPECPSLQK